MHEMVYLITSLGSDVVDTSTEVVNNERIVTIDEYWLNLVISMFLPIVVAFVTKRFAAGNIKALVLAFLAIINGWLTSLLNTGGTFELKSALTSMIVSFIAATAVHFGLLAPANVTGRDGAIQRSLPGGIGKDTAHP